MLGYSVLLPASRRQNTCENLSFPLWSLPSPQSNVVLKMNPMKAQGFMIMVVAVVITKTA